MEELDITFATVSENDQLGEHDWHRDSRVDFVELPCTVKIFAFNPQN